MGFVDGYFFLVDPSLFIYSVINMRQLLRRTILVFKGITIFITSQRSYILDKYVYILCVYILLSV